MKLLSRTILKAIGEPDLSLHFDWGSEQWRFKYMDRRGEPVARTLQELTLEAWVEIGKNFVLGRHR